MRLHILFLLLFPCLLLSTAPQAQAAKNSKAAVKAAGYKEIPAFNWGLAATGFVEMFKMRNREVESSHPNRFFPGTAALALGRIDDSGHFLLLKCGASSSCGSIRDVLEDRMVFATLLDAVQTPKVRKDQLYNPVTWELSPLGEKYVDILRKRYPDLSTRLGRLIGAAFAGE